MGEEKKLDYVSMSRLKLVSHVKEFDDLLNKGVYDRVKFDEIVKKIRTHLIVVSNNKN